MKSEIVGNGLLAKAFKNSNSDDCLFFCSGVSKSNEILLSEFERESTLLNETIERGENKCIVYFSSVLAPTEVNEYYIHKKKMEKLVTTKSKRYLIIRLPQVAGRVFNNTLLSNFIKNIYLEKKFEIYNNAPRTIVDVEDVVKIFDEIYKTHILNNILILCPSYYFQPIELVGIISMYLNKKADYSIIEKTSIQHCEPCVVVNRYQYMFGDLDKYLENVVRKYIDFIVYELNKRQ
jgi:hypothetical protein